MSGILGYDENASGRIERLSGTSQIVAQRERVLALLDPRPEEQVLDVGCGPGHLSREIAVRVGPSGRAVGIDVSEAMLAIAESHRAPAGAHASLNFHNADATALPFADATFDAAVATQVYEFVADIPRALAELYRVLRRDGRVVILDTDWDSVVWHSGDRPRMERVLDAWQGRVANPHLPCTLASQLRQAGFELSRSEVFPIFEPEGCADSYSIQQIKHIGAAVAEAGTIPVEEVDLWAGDLRTLSSTSSYFFSVNRYIFVARSGIRAC